VSLIPIKRRINTELFIDKTAALYIQKGARKNMELRKEAKIVGAQITYSVGMRNHIGSLF